MLEKLHVAVLETMCRIVGCRSVFGRFAGWPLDLCTVIAFGPGTLREERVAARRAQGRE